MGRSITRAAAGRSRARCCFGDTGGQAPVSPLPGWGWTLTVSLGEGGGSRGSEVLVHAVYVGVCECEPARGCTQPWGCPCTPAEQTLGPGSRLESRINAPLPPVSACGCCSDVAFRVSEA